MTTTHDLQHRLGAIIRFARLTAELTQVQLGKRLKVPDTYISHIEAGRRCPRPKMLARLAKVLEIDLDELRCTAVDWHLGRNIRAIFGDVCIVGDSKSEHEIYKGKP